MTEQDLTETQKSVESILDALGVDHVVYIDDANKDIVPVDYVIVVAQKLKPSSLLRAFPELGDSVPDDPDILAEKITRIYQRLDTPTQSKRGMAVVAALPSDTESGTDDLANIAIINQIIPEGRLTSLTPSQWDQQKDKLLQIPASQRSLFLFDQDLSTTGGDSEGGIKIIASLLTMDGTENLICGLLTHTVTPENQPELWDALSNKYSIAKDRFVVIPKLHLSQTPILFAQALKFAALSPDFDKLKRKTKEILEAAAKTAADRIDAVNIYDLDHIVFQVSTKEGLWEPDMLFRLHALFHCLESRELAHNGGDLEKIAAKLRAVSTIPTNYDSLPIPQSAWELQRLELYESAEHINKNHLPLELGDIFELTDADHDKKYILLAQPCDLMVRSKGKREPELQRISLAEVVNPEKEPKHCEELPFYDKSSSKKWFVKFKKIHFIRDRILDLCVFNQDGVARLEIGGDAPSDIRPTWQSRHEELSSQWRKELKKVDILEPRDRDGRAIKTFKKQIAPKLRDDFLKEDLFTGTIEENDGVRSIKFNCRRIGRLSQARAIGMLMSYTSTLGRPAYDRTFVDDPKCTT